jgi:hypothetical protein
MKLERLVFIFVSRIPRIGCTRDTGGVADGFWATDPTGVTSS